MVLVMTVNPFDDPWTKALEEKVAGARRLGSSEFREYLDSAIRLWRSRRVEAAENRDETQLIIAACYVDAYQSVRATFFGGLLPVEDEG